MKLDTKIIDWSDKSWLQETYTLPGIRIGFAISLSLLVLWLGIIL